jgi:hypothetical protein
VSREFYKDYNAAFAAQWKKTTGEDVTLNQSHGGSSRQARSVVDGLEADVITMNQHNDIDVLHTRGGLVIQPTGPSGCPTTASPTTSVSVILVRKGNPKNIRDWTDLGKPGVGVIIPNPKTSGNGRYTYLAAWGAAVTGGVSPEAAKALVTRIFANVPVLDGVLPGFDLALGFTLLYISLIVLIPLSAAFLKTFTLTWPSSSGRGHHAARAGLLPADLRRLAAGRADQRRVRPDRGLGAGALQFPGKRCVDALVDLPFALPTAVAGIALTALYAEERLDRPVLAAASR